VARHRPPGRAGGYNKTTLGEADDATAADGVKVLGFRQAQDLARKWLRGVEGGLKIVAGCTVGAALDDYLAAFSKKDLANTRRRVEQFISPALGHVKLAQLTAAQVRAFHNERANTPARRGCAPAKATSRRSGRSTIPSRAASASRQPTGI
jgi:hypothetical protein